MFPSSTAHDIICEAFCKYMAWSHKDTTHETVMSPGYRKENEMNINKNEMCPHGVGCIDDVWLVALVSGRGLHEHAWRPLPGILILMPGGNASRQLEGPWTGTHNFNFF